MNLYRKYVRWIWFAVVIVVTGWEAIREGISWISLTPVLLAAVFVASAFVIRLREGVARDERTRAVSNKALAIGFVVTVFAGITTSALSIPYALFISLDAGMIAFLASYLYYRYV